MSGVNADYAGLLDTAGKLNATANHVEGTRNSLALRYRQLGAGWGDKKYQELGDILRECNSALRSVAKTLLLGEKSVLMLADSLREYENLNLGNGSGAGGSQLPGGNAAARAETYVQDNLGVWVNGKAPAGYPEVITARYENAQPNARKVFDRFAESLVIRDADYPTSETPHYAPRDREGHPRGVYYNAGADASNPRGAGSTYFHELGHMIDHTATGCQGHLSNTEEFRAALVADGENVLRLFQQQDDRGQDQFLRYLYQDAAHSFSDLIDATTSGQLAGRYGHRREYWQRAGALQAEAFAHFFEASMGGGWKLELLSNMFPTAFGIFSDMMDSLQPQELNRVLRR